MNGDGDGDGAETGTGTKGEVNKGVQDGNEDGSGDGVGTGMETGVETRERTQHDNCNGSRDVNGSSSGDGNGDEDGNRDGNEDGIGEGGGEAKKCKKSHKSCRRPVGNRRDLVGKRKKCRQEKVGSVASNPDHLEKSKEAEGGAQGTQGLDKNCTSTESMFPWLRLMRDFRNKCH